MCGIVGYVGNENAPFIVEKSLKKLEYRGYDSVGIATIKNNKMEIYKTQGKVEKLSSIVDTQSLNDCHISIGHTRWATHGKPSDINSHPHRVGKVTLVHNGIIENYDKIMDDYEPISQTDTEIAAYTINKFYNGDPKKAIIDATKVLKGSFAFGIIFDEYPDTIFAIRRQSPLIVAKGKEGNFIASDIPALLEYTKDYFLPEEDELCVITKDSIEFYDASLNKIEKEMITATWDEKSASKDGYDHFMMKEIHEQPSVIRNLVNHYKTETGFFEDMDMNVKGNIHIIGCGSAMHAAYVGKNAIEKYARINVFVHIASEFRYVNPILSKDDTVILISQSGETADTLAALNLVKSRGLKTIAIVNVWGSSIARAADQTIYTNAGPEISVATTKAYLSQCCILLMLAMKFAKNKIDAEQYKKMLDEFETIPDKISNVIERKETLKALAQSRYKFDNAFYLGRGADYYIGMEGSLKLKEISYVHSECYASGELKHGTISLITEKTPVYALITDPDLCAKTESNIKEVLARGADVLAFLTKGINITDAVKDVFYIDEICPAFSALVVTVALQIYAYYVALARGCEIDTPRNLAKSVTVE